MATKTGAVLVIGDTAATSSFRMISRTRTTAKELSMADAQTAATGAIPIPCGRGKMNSMTMLTGRANRSQMRT